MIASRFGFRLPSVTGLRVQVALVLPIHGSNWNIETHLYLRLFVFFFLRLILELMLSADWNLNFYNTDTQFKVEFQTDSVLGF